MLELDYIQILRKRGSMSHIVINTENCKACYLCVKECPKSLIKVSEKTNKLGNNVVEFCDKNKHMVMRMNDM